VITDPNFDNMPPIFKLLEPVIEAAPGVLQNDLGNLINALYKASPAETVYYLREILENSPNPLTAITMRRILNTFPPDLQANLRDLVRQKRTAN
jgi:hypothetical protein